MPAPSSAPTRVGWRASLLFLFCLATLLASCSEPTPPPPPPPVPVPDTTSRNFTWDIQYFGDGQSAFYDVYALNDTLAYAVGDIEKRDSTGSFSDLYNAARWDGRSWTLTKIYWHSWGDSITGVYRIPIVFQDTQTGFIFSDGGAILYFDGKSLVHDFTITKMLVGFNAVWGPQSERYFVGPNGTIIRCNKRSYIIEPSPTTIDLTDVWGNAREVWATGGTLRSSESVRLLKTNGSWINMDSLIKPYQPYTFGVWCDEKGYSGKGFVGFASEGVFYLDPNDSTWKTTPANLFEGKLPGSQGLYNSIRGSAGNNVFAAGDFGAVIHFNGRNWKCFTEIISYPESRLLTGLCITKNRVFISGTSYGERGILIVGTRR